MEKIYTHSGPAHNDEFIAVSLLLTKYPEAVIYRVATLPDVIENDALIVDIGLKYDGKQYFDHHQSTEIPASFVLVLKDVFGIDLYQYPKLFEDFLFLDYCDRFGAQQAQNLIGKRSEIINPIANAIVNIFGLQNEIQPGSPLHSMLQEIGKGILISIQKRIEGVDVINKSELITYPEGVVLVNCDQPINVTLASLVIPDLIGVVCQNRETDKLSIIRVNDNPYFHPSNLKDKATFIHKTGFLAVVPKEIFQKTDIDRCVMPVREPYV